MFRRRAALVAMLAPALIASPAAADEEPARDARFAGTAQVTAVEMVVEVRARDGALPDDLTVDDFSVAEDGDPAQVVGIERFRTSATGPALVSDSPPAARGLARGAPGAWDWRLVIWIDQELSSSRSIRRAAEALAAQAGALTRLGTVEVVVAGSDRRIVLPRTRSSPLVEETLRGLAGSTAGRDQLRQIRKSFLSTLQLQGQLDGRNQPADALARSPRGEPGAEGVRERGAAFSRRSAIRGSASAERLLIDRRLDLLTSFLSLNAEPAPKALILVSDGWDLDPRDFYLVGLPNQAEFGAELTALLETTDGGSAFDGVSRHLSTTGWTTLSIATGALEAGSSIAAENSGSGRLGEIVAGGQESISETPMRLVMRPNEPLYALAEATGGEALTGVRQLPAALGRLADRVRLTYQVARPPDTRQRKVVVRATRPGLEVRAPVWAGIPAGEAVASARARNLLAGDPVEGDLPFEAAIGLVSSSESDAERVRGELQARIDLSSLRVALEASPISDIRATIAIAVPGASPFVHQSVIPRQRLARLSSWTYSLPIDLPRGFEKVAVVLEESGTGAWGAGLAAVVEGSLPPARRALAEPAGADDVASAVETDPDAIFDLLPARKPVLLSPPEVEPALGKVRFEPLVAAESVSAIEFLLDGAKVARSQARPFEVTVDLGRLPVPRRLEAVAYDAAGVELGRDALELNGGIGVFGVRLIEPRGATAVGAVDVEAELTLPAAHDNPLDRLELYWNDARVATLFAPPFRQRILIPPAAPSGYITAVAYRRDGSSVEDVRLMNSEGAGESLDVRLVELATAVLDADGRPVAGLTRDSFRVHEEGLLQPLDAVRDGRELPLTLGLAIDSSASLFEEMADVKRAAIDFVGLTLDPADRAFVVDFDSEPRLAVDLTGDQRQLYEGIAALRPGGSTALCDALVYSLARLQRVRGRRALVVLSDGLGRDERVSFAACQRFVARSGVPVYLLLLPEEGPSDPHRAEVAAKRIESLVGPSGGRAIRVASLAELGPVYRQVQAELRAQYVVSYYPAALPDGAAAGWREVRVAIDRPGLTVRAAQGYYR